MKSTTRASSGSDRVSMSHSIDWIVNSLSLWISLMKSFESNSVDSIWFITLNWFQIGRRFPSSLSSPTSLCNLNLNPSHHCRLTELSLIEFFFFRPRNGWNGVSAVISYFQLLLIVLGVDVGGVSGVVEWHLPSIKNRRCVFQSITFEGEGTN